MSWYNKLYLGKIVPNQKGGSEIYYISYKETIERAHRIGSAIISEKLFNQPEGENLKMFGIFSKNRVEWLLTDIGSCLFGLTSIPIYDTLGDENITYVLKHT